jgi:hypothetical protein
MQSINVHQGNDMKTTQASLAELVSFQAKPDPSPPSGQSAEPAPVPPAGEGAGDIVATDDVKALAQDHDLQN